MQGGGKEPLPYLKNEQGEKISDPKQQEQIFRRIWTNVFRISDEENQQFDRQHEDEITRVMSQEENIQRIRPYDLSDLTRLDENNQLTKPISRRDF